MLTLSLENDLFDLNRAYRATTDLRERERIGARMLKVHEAIVRSSQAAGEGGA